MYIRGCLLSFYLGTLRKRRGVVYCDDPVHLLVDCSFALDLALSLSFLVCTAKKNAHITRVVFVAADCSPNVVSNCSRSKLEPRDD